MSRNRLVDMFVDVRPDQLQISIPGVLIPGRNVMVGGWPQESATEESPSTEDDYVGNVRRRAEEVF